MIEPGDIVMLDENFDHPDIHALKNDDPYIFKEEGEVIERHNVYENITELGGETKKILVTQRVEVSWEDGEWTGIYPTDSLIKVGQFRPGITNPNRTFKAQRLWLGINETAKQAFGKTSMIFDEIDFEEVND